MIYARLESGGPGGRYWYAVLVDDIAGTESKRSLGNKNKVGKREARRLCRKLETEAQEVGVVLTGKPPLMTAWKDRFFKTRQLARTSRQGYETTVNLLVAALGDWGMDRYTRDHAALFRETLVEREVSDATVCKHIRNCKSLFNEAKDRDLIVLNPFDRQRGAADEVDVEFTFVPVRDLETMLAVVPNAKWSALLGLTRLAGMRKAEALRLTWQDVDFDARMLRVKNKRRRRTTKDRTRYTPIQPRLYEVLLARFEGAQAGELRVVGYSTSHFAGGNPRGGYAQMQAIQAAAGLEPWADPFHDLRRSLISDWYADGHSEADMMKMLGNSKDVARRYYHKILERTKHRITGEALDAKDIEIRKLRRLLDEAKRKTDSP